MIEMEGDNMIEREWRERLQVGSLCTSVMMFLKKIIGVHGYHYSHYRGVKSNSKALCHVCQNFEPSLVNSVVDTGTSL